MRIELVRGFLWIVEGELYTMIYRFELIEAIESSLSLYRAPLALAPFLANQGGRCDVLEHARSNAIVLQATDAPRIGPFCPKKNPAPTSPLLPQSTRLLAWSFHLTVQALIKHLRSHIISSGGLSEHTPSSSCTPPIPRTSGAHFETKKILSDDQITSLTTPD